MTACLQILVQGKWQWAQHWPKGRDWRPAHTWASEIYPTRPWRLLLRGFLGLHTWTCSDGDSRMEGMWSPPVFRAWLATNPAIVQHVGGISRVVPAAETADPASFVLRGSEENYIVLFAGDEVEVAARPKGTKMRPELIYGGTKKAFSEDPLAAFSPYKPIRIRVGEAS